MSVDSADIGCRFPLVYWRLTVPLNTLPDVSASQMLYAGQTSGGQPMDDEDKLRPQPFTLNGDLNDLSVRDINQRIILPEGEIARLRAEG
jgi:hypothetical protein